LSYYNIFFGPTAESYNVNKKNISVTTWAGVSILIWLLFPKTGASLSIDEVNLSMGELYSVVTNKEAKGKK
jgi:hypothetical protein